VASPLNSVSIVPSDPLSRGHIGRAGGGGAAKAEEAKDLWDAMRLEAVTVYYLRSPRKMIRKAATGAHRLRVQAKCF
jgi:hypothetical protein